MSAEVMEKWLKAGRSAIINQRFIKPVEHNLLKGKPLSSQKGQAEAFFLIDEKCNWWLLKKFHSTCKLDCAYLNKVGSLLPKEPGFICGTERQILSRGSLVRAKGYYYSKQLEQWLDATILMPKVNGIDWSTLADEIRDGSVTLNQQQRFTICKNLARLIELLENSRCCHRDLSCGNIFIDTNTWDVCLIDFDSFYHPSLQMPRATTCGTAGYTAHLAWNNGNLDPHRTWREKVDRYALSLLNVEFLLVSRGAKVTEEGGIFSQNELRNCSGPGINSIVSRLKLKYPQAAQLLQKTMNSQSFAHCPSPGDWSNFCKGIPGLGAKPPSLADLQDTSVARIAAILGKCRPAAPLWPAPSLQEMPAKTPQIPKATTIQAQTVDLPPDPWAKKPAKCRSIFRRLKPWPLA